MYSGNMVSRLFRKRVHASWLIAVISGGILAGVAGSLLLPHSLFAGIEWLLLGVLLLPIVFTRPVYIMLLLAFVAGSLLGLWRGSVQRVELAGYGEFLNQKVVVQGKIAEDVPRAANGTLEMRLQNVEVAGKQLPGQVWASSASD